MHLLTRRYGVRLSNTLNRGDTMIKVYNISQEEHTDSKNDYYIGRGSILGNPYTHINNKGTKALYVVPTRDEAIERYSHYFDIMYAANDAFKRKVDEIYDKYKKGEDVYLGCYCKPLSCHGDVIADKLQRRMIKERIKENKRK